MPHEFPETPQPQSPAQGIADLILPNGPELHTRSASDEDAPARCRGFDTVQASDVAPTALVNTKLPDLHLQVEYWPLERLIPAARNARLHPAKQITGITRSMGRFGVVNPVLCDENGVLIAGHARLQAAREAGLATMPVIVLRHLSEAEKEALAIADNKLASDATWDEAKLRSVLSDLADIDFDLDYTGFDDREIDDLLFRIEDPNEVADDACPYPEVVVTKPGDLWQCGNHRILCGDATSESDVAWLLGSATPVLMVTDPPYGVEYNPDWRAQAGLGMPRQRGKVRNDDRCDWTAAYQLFGGDVCYVWHAGIYTVEVAQGLRAAGFELRAQIIWSKPRFVISRAPYHWQHEPCWMAVRRGRPSHWCGDRSQSTVWEVSNRNTLGGIEDATGHGTQKPVALMKRPILNHTHQGEAVYDPFLGSGTSLIAAELTRRTCYALEIEPVYTDMAILRWQRLSGQVAVRAADGKRFSELPGERLTPAELAKGGNQ